jgi:hypothetical protein
VHEATWLRLDEAPHLLAHKGEQEMAAKAAALIGGDAEL